MTTPKNLLRTAEIHPNIGSYRPRLLFYFILVGTTVLFDILMLILDTFFLRMTSSQGSAFIIAAINIIITFMFFLPPLLFPQLITLEYNDNGVFYTDPRQVIYVPWGEILGLQYGIFNRVDVKVNQLSSDFSIPLNHTQAERLIEEIEGRLYQNKN